MIDPDRLPTIAAPRVLLRWLTEDDVDALFSIFSDPEVMRYWSTLPMTDQREARELLEHVHESFRRQTLWQWGVARRDDDLVIGTCTLLHFEADNRRGEIGYALGREHWGQGYMGEALEALLGFAFGELDLHRLEADVDPRNSSSIRSLERLGFQREGYLRERWLVGGEAQDALFFGLLRREWTGWLSGHCELALQQQDGSLEGCPAKLGANSATSMPTDNAHALTKIKVSVESTFHRMNDIHLAKWSRVRYRDCREGFWWWGRM